MTIYWIYIATCLLSATIVLVATPWVKWVALRCDKFDIPCDRKIHKQPMVRLGGAAIFLATLLSSLCACQAASTFTYIPTGSFKATLLILLGGCGFFLVGFADDLLQLSALNRLAIQFAISIVLWILGLRIEICSLPGLSSVAIGWLSLPVTVLWLSGVVNAINWIDGLDGLAAGVSGISAASLIVLCTAMSQPIPAVLGAALVGSLLGFLYYNYSPATIFMGDGGSYFLGFILASLCIVGPQHIDSPFASLLPLLVLAVPLGDMLSVIAIRLYRKKSPFNADRLHLHHRLLDKDFSQKAAVWMLYVLTFITSAIALAVAGLIDGLGLLLILTLTIVVLLSWARRQTSTHSALVATGE